MDMKNSPLSACRLPGKLIMVVCLLFILISCKPSAPKVVAGTGDLTGFEIVEIPGSTIQYAMRKDGQNQIVIEGYVTNNQRSGEWVEYNEDGEVGRIDNYVDGYLEGLSLKFSSRGQIELKSRYKRGILEGAWTQYKFGRVIEQRNYKAGKLDGVVRSYNDRTWDLKQEAEYKDGVQHGFFRYYDEEGKVTLEYEYKNGEKVSGGIKKN